MSLSGKVGFLILLSIGTGCTGAVSDPQIPALRREIAEQKKKLDEFRSDLDSLKRDQGWEQMRRDWDAVAYLTPGSRGYSTIRSDFCIMTVDLADVRAYANGSRIVLRFGNPTGATLTGVAATIEWGAVDDRGTPKNEEAKSKKVEFEKSFRAGAWTTAAVVLEGTPPTALGFVRLRDMSNKGIILYR